MVCKICNYDNPKGNKICDNCGCDLPREIASSSTDNTDSSHQSSFGFASMDSVQRQSDTPKFNQMSSSTTQQQYNTGFAAPSSSASSAKFVQPVSSSNPIMKYLVKGFLLFAIVCFLFPFTTVSCNVDENSDNVKSANALNPNSINVDTDIIWTKTGFEMIKTEDENLVDDDTEDQQPEDVKDTKGILDTDKLYDTTEDFMFKGKTNPYLILAICCIAIGVVFSIIKKNKFAAIASGTATFLIIMYSLTFKSFYDFGDFTPYVKIEHRYGYYLCLLSLIAATVTAICVYAKDGDN